LRRGNEMTTKSRLLMLMVLAAPFHAFATTKPLSGDLQSRIGTRDQWVEYFMKGDSIPETGTSYIAIIDTSNQSIMVTTRDVSSRDSLFYHFIPTDRVIFDLSACIEWEEGSGSLLYSYALHCDSTSSIPIDNMDTELENDIKEISAPKGWTGIQVRKDYSWSRLYGTPLIKPGESLSGFDLRSISPPVLGDIFVMGEEKILGQAGEDFLLFDVASAVGSNHYRVKVETIVPGISPEAIDPVEWTSRIYDSLRDLRNAAFMSNQDMQDLQNLIGTLFAKIVRIKEPKLDNLIDYVNDTLAELEDFQDRIEPEAYGYIAENLKHMLRNTDIIQFEDYPQYK
jgi:hypothetical protein